MELNREQIIKALGCCSHPNMCNECPCHNLRMCWDMKQQAIALIKELTVEVEAMRGAANSYKMHYENAKSEVAREIFEEIEDDCFDQFGYLDYEAFYALKKKYTEEE